jgi:hypothetical protein
MSLCVWIYESHNVSGGAGLKVCCYEQVVRAHPQVAGKLVTAQRAAYLQAGLQVGPAVSPGLEKKQEVINSIEVWIMLKTRMETNRRRSMT